MVCMVEEVFRFWGLGITIGAWNNDQYYFGGGGVPYYYHYYYYFYCSIIIYSKTPF